MQENQLPDGLYDSGNLDSPPDSAFILETLCQAQRQLVDDASPATLALRERLRAVILNTAEGVRQIPQDYRNVALVLQMSSRRFFTKVLIPSALPYIFTGLRISIGLAWLAIIAAEIVMPGTPGIGFFIWDANQNGYVSDIVLGVIWIGAVGLILDRLMAWVQKRISPGQ